MIYPFVERTVQNGKSYGLSTAGYDVRLVLADGAGVRLMKPGDFFLAATVERFDMPHHTLGIVHDKSSWARRGLTVQNTVIEPGWAGFLTLELTNHGNSDIFLYKDDPIAQIVFHFLDQVTEQPYTGKYQNQPYGPQPAKDE